VGTVLGFVIIVFFVAQLVIKSRRRWRDGSAYFKPPTKGVAVSEIDPDGMIRARGEIWKARSESGVRIEAGTEVEVIRAETLQLWVRPLPKDLPANESKGN